jgi:pyruvate/2-oxoglutarate dehydrogenase complex dihydrolipoamide acyltransferase (E2) component
MAHEIAIPKLGLTMTDCTLVSWAKSDGDAVNKGELLYAIETDKITTDIEADDTGFLRRLAEPDTLHQVGAVIGALHPSREAALSARGDAARKHAEPINVRVATLQGGPTLQPSADGASRRVRSSPLARRIAVAAGLDIATVAGTGFGGSVLRRDVEAALSKQKAQAPANASAVSAAPAPRHAPSRANGAIASRRPLAGMRHAIAQRMKTSLQSSAQMTGFGRIDMTEAARLRSACVALQTEFGVRVTYTDIVLKAAANVLASMPSMNASIVGDEIVTWSEVNVGLAVALDDGLIVPVIRDADKKSIAEIGGERRDLVQRARDGRLGREELDGGTFSLSNFGSYGGDFETPILNPPQSALLGIGAITDEPVVRDGQIVIRPMMAISLTFDHRLIDGAVAGRFRAQLRAALESPLSMMARMH